MKLSALIIFVVSRVLVLTSANNDINLSLDISAIFNLYCKLNLATSEQSPPPVGKQTQRPYHNIPPYLYGLFFYDI
jgi:hypothetical protein